jgi:hypothetical protein
VIFHHAWHSLLFPLWFALQDFELLIARSTHHASLGVAVNVHVSLRKAGCPQIAFQWRAFRC